MLKNENEKKYLKTRSIKTRKTLVELKIVSNYISLLK